MAPRVNLFSAWESGMKFAGATPYSPKQPHILFLLGRLLMLYGSAHYVLVMLLNVLLGERAFEAKLESALFLLAGTPCVYKHFLFLFKKKEVYLLVERMNALLEEVENVYGTEPLMSWKKVCNTVFGFYVVQFICVIIPVICLSYYKYYVEGVENVTPFELYIPFERENHIHRLMVFEFVSFLGPVAGLIAGNTFFGSLTVAVTGVLSKIADQLTQINQTNERLLVKRIAKWHSETITIVETMNSQLGTAFLIEYMFAIFYVCFSGYMMIKIGSDDNVKKNILLCVACIIIPIFYCICGHVIHLKNEKLCAAIFENSWHELAPKERKELILPALLGNKGLNLHYRRLIKFNMTTYLTIVKQSYSFLTVLKLMDN